MIWKDIDGKTFIQIGTTKPQMASMKKDGIKIRIINTPDHEAIRFLEALNDLAPEATYKIDSILTAIYNLGVEDKRKSLKNGHS